MRRGAALGRLLLALALCATLTGAQQEGVSA
jgi:hypothetical protein